MSRADAPEDDAPALTLRERILFLGFALPLGLLWYGLMVYGVPALCAPYYLASDALWARRQKRRLT